MNIMDADALATQGAGASATMILTAECVEYVEPN